MIGCNSDHIIDNGPKSINHDKTTTKRQQHFTTTNALVETQGEWIKIFHNHDNNDDHLKMVMRAIMTMQWYNDYDDNEGDDDNDFMMIMKVMMMTT